MLELIGSLKIGYFILEKEMAELNQKKRLKTTRSTPSCVKVLFYLGEKSTAHSMQLLTSVLENQYSKSIRRFPGFKFLSKFSTYFLGHDGHL